MSGGKGGHVVLSHWPGWLRGRHAALAWTVRRMLLFAAKPEDDMRPPFARAWLRIRILFAAVAPDRPCCLRRARLRAPVVCAGRVCAPLLFAPGAFARPCCLNGAGCAFSPRPGPRRADRNRVPRTRKGEGRWSAGRRFQPEPALRRARSIIRKRARRSARQRGVVLTAPGRPLVRGFCPGSSASSLQAAVVPPGGAPAPPGCGFAKPARRRRTRSATQDAS